MIHRITIHIGNPYATPSQREISFVGRKGLVCEETLSDVQLHVSYPRRSCAGYNLYLIIVWAA
jgi:hypothetical protein